MFWQIFSFEIKYRLKRPATYIYFLVFFFIAVVCFSTGSTPASEKVFHNSPAVLAQFITLVSMLMMLVCSAIMGVPLYRDIDYNTSGYYLAYPISERGYFWGRFLGSIIFVILIGTSILFGAYFGSIIGAIFDWVPAKRIGPNHFINYLYPFVFIALPNLFLASCIFFGLVAATRNVKVIYSGSILLLIAYLLANFLIRDIDNKNLVKLLDPFALNTLNLEMRFYTPAEQNSLIVPVKGLFLYNRLIWSAAGFVILMATYFSFSFKRFFGGNMRKKRLEEGAVSTKIYLSKIPQVTVSFAGNYYRRVMFNKAKIEYLNIVRDIYFRAILLGGVIFLVIDYWIGVPIYSVPNLPLTVNLMEYKSYDYTVFIFIIIVFYTGETIHRDKTTRFAIINDALPTPDWVLYGSKLLGLVGLAFTLTTIPLILGVIVQVLKGYTHFNFHVYFIELYVITFPQFIQMIMLSFAVHILINNKFAGHAVAIIIWILMFLMRNYAQMDYNLLFYSYTPTYLWSDMDGIGHMATAEFWYNFYWILFGGLLIVVAAVFYDRGVITSYKERRKIARERFHGPIRYITAVLLVGFVATGIYTYYNVSYVNNYLSGKENDQRQVEYEKKLKKYENLDQPKITRLKIFTDIFPDERKVLVKGMIVMVNKTDKPISTLHLDGTGLESYNIKYNGKAIPATYPLIYKRGKFNWFRSKNDTAKYRIYQLPSALKPGDSAMIEVNSVVAYRGFTNDISGTDIVHNGTFYSGGLPSIGYNPDNELFSDEKRKKYDLPEKKDEYPVQTDPKGIKTLLFNGNADLVTFDITVSTSADQMAIAPGYLDRQWKQNGRNYYHYVQDAPAVDLFFDIISARYATLKDNVKLYNGQNVATELYYHPPHSTNLQRFESAYKDGLDYYSKAYGPFQFKQMRLLEFPKYRAFAQSFPNTVSYAEGFGWSADYSNPDRFDYGYFVTAHELAHQWWGHQVVPNRTRGSNLISEALAEYTALILTQRKYGKDNMKRFLKQEIDGYLRGRANEAKKENVFINCNRPYEWYNKGSLILYGLQDLIGMDTLNKALHEFRDAYAFHTEPPYPGSTDLYRFIAKHVPDSVKYYLDDTWNKITLYENKVIDAKVTPTGKKDEYKIDLKVSTRKMYADSAGNEKPAAKMNDYIDIGVFAADSKDKNGRNQTNPLFLKKYKLTAGVHDIQLIVKGNPPVRAGIDPYVKLIDRIPDDNIKDL
jgi:ABC-2 type transport system permease protein